MTETVAAPEKAPKYAVTKLDTKEVLDQYLSGKTSAQIATENGITRQALQAWLLRNDREGWETAQTCTAQEDLDEAQDYRKSIQTKLATADKDEQGRLNIALACARDAEKSAQWRLERVCRRIYGQDAPPVGVNAVQININLRGKPLDVVADTETVIVHKSNVSETG